MLAAAAALSVAGCGSIAVSDDDDDGGAGQDGGATDDAGVVDVTVDVSRAVRVLPGEATGVDITLTRTAFDGPVTIALTGLPASVTSAAITIPASATVGSLIVEASASAAQAGPVPIQLSVTTAETRELAMALYVAGRPGSFDESFSGDGSVLLVSDVGTTVDDGRDILLDPLGRVVVTGVVQDIQPNQGVMYRLTSDGVLDGGFGDGGRLVPVFDSVEQVIAHPTDGYVIGGYGGDGMVIDQVDEHGRVDNGFAEVTTAVESNAFALVPLADGFLVAGGGAFSKYDYDGVLDTAFGAAGTVTGLDNFVSPTADSQGRIVVAGGFRVSRLSPNGAPDPTFGRGFELTFPTLPETPLGIIRFMALDPDDGGYGCGEERTQGTPDVVQHPVLLRFRADGTAESSFGTDGVAILLPGNESGSCRQVVPLADGRLLVAAFRFIDTIQFTTELWMLHADGTFDPSFGDDGVLVIEGVDFRRLALDADGLRAVIVGRPSAGTEIWAGRVWL